MRSRIPVMCLVRYVLPSFLWPGPVRPMPQSCRSGLRHTRPAGIMHKLSRYSPAEGRPAVQFQTIYASVLISRM
jgi:hypothetical protein